MHTHFPISEPVFVIVGPTAIGKTNLSLSLAEKYNCEIVSLDSMQVYRYMDIGTAKVTLAERDRVPHHLIDIVNPDETYDANKYVKDALQAISSIHSRSKIPLLTGGTGLYLRSLIEGLFDSIGDFTEVRIKLIKELEKNGSSKLHEHLAGVDRESAQRIHENDTHRLIRALEIFYGTGKTWSEYIALQEKSKCERFSNLLQIGLTCERNLLYSRINERTDAMIKEGLVGEVEGLLSRGYHRNLKSMKSIGYRHMVGHILDEWSLEYACDILARDTRRYAKRQFTWFKKMDITWLDVAQHNKIISTIESFL